LIGFDKQTWVQGMNFWEKMKKSLTKFSKLFSNKFRLILEKIQISNDKGLLVTCCRSQAARFIVRDARSSLLNHEEWRTTVLEYLNAPT
jgi:phosphopantetheine adenylyltransferase